jgi:hypothetical protein
MRVMYDIWYFYMAVCSYYVASFEPFPCMISCCRGFIWSIFSIYLIQVFISCVGDHSDEF